MPPRPQPEAAAREHINALLVDSRLYGEQARIVAEVDFEQLIGIEEDFKP